jgi:trans-aconitate methyltransferase
MSLRSHIVSQFKQPSGILGHLAGFIMARRPSNRDRNLWTLELLELQPDDRLLEIGFGPGIAIEGAAKIITEGLICGIDHSPVMFRQASRRNARAIARGTVKLLLGTLENLPPPGQPFTKICSANVVQFWSDPVATFRRLHDMLAPGGVIASTYMPRTSHATAADALKKAEEIVGWLKQAGFTDIAIEEKPLRPVPAISVVARKQAPEGQPS